MSSKIKGIKYVILNVYGGEALYHPDIVEILEKCRERYNASYKDRWHLTITTTTNAIVPEKRFNKIIPLIDEFTTSYHAENTAKKKEQFKNNLLNIKNNNKRLKCVVLMHTDSQLFDDTVEIQNWLQQQQIKFLPRQLDDTRDNYNTEQIQWFDDFYRKKQSNKEQPIKFVATNDGNYDLTQTGRSCCGGRQLCLDQNYKHTDYYVKNSFPDWYCSVNEFFVYIKQVNGEVFVNKDCRMNFHNQIGPIGNLSDTKKLLDETRKIVSSDNPPVIQCKKSRCYCGLCAPKSQDFNKFKSIMEKYHAK
jgi:hypothetical protein